MVTERHTVYRCHRLLGWLLMVLSPVAFGTAHPIPSLATLRDAMHVQNTTPEMLSQLAWHADRGNRTAARLLAQQLAKSTLLRDLNRAAVLYEQAFDAGRGDPYDLAELAKLTARHPLLKARWKARIRTWLGRMGLAPDFETVHARLEIFLAYPHLMPLDTVRHLLTLYENACISDCRTLTYKARLLATQGNRAGALQAYEQAIPHDAAAVELFIELLGDDASTHLAEFARVRLDTIDTWHIDSVSALAGKLAQLVPDDPDLTLAWLDHAIEGNALAALISKANLMMDLPERFTPAATLDLVNQIAARSPADGKRLRAMVYMVREWRTLNPKRAYTLLQEAVEDGDPEAYMGLGKLYSSGILDEADQQQAIAHYMKLAVLGRGPAFLSIAKIYKEGRAICHDPVKAHAYAMLALELGQTQARSLLDDTTKALSADALDAAHHLASQLRQQIRGMQ